MSELQWPIKVKTEINQSDFKKGDVFLWRSAMTGRFEIHTFHSNAGYGVKTFTDYDDKTGNSLLVNWSGVCGIIETTDGN
jgi:hypothetical protein